MGMSEQLQLLEQRGTALLIRVAAGPLSLRPQWTMAWRPPQLAGARA